MLRRLMRDSRPLPGDVRRGATAPQVGCWVEVSARAARRCETLSMAIEEGDSPSAHVIFDLAVEDGWPPVGSERLWAFHLGGDHYRIDNVPWFVHDLAVGDVVRAQAPDADSHPVFREVVDRSDHVTVRLICFRQGPLGGDLARALAPFTALGVYGEGVSQYGMVALDIEATAPLHAIVATLRRGVDDGSWEYEEGRVTQAWIDATVG